jgi:hypothetical protein
VTSFSESTALSEKSGTSHGSSWCSSIFLECSHFQTVVALILRQNFPALSCSFISHCTHKFFAHPQFQWWIGCILSRNHPSCGPVMVDECWWAS